MSGWEPDDVCLYVFHMCIWTMFLKYPVPSEQGYSVLGQEERCEFSLQRIGVKRVRLVLTSVTLLIHPLTLAYLRHRLSLSFPCLKWGWNSHLPSEEQCRAPERGRIGRWFGKCEG